MRLHIGGAPTRAPTGGERYSDVGRDHRGEEGGREPPVMSDALAS